MHTLSATEREEAFPIHIELGTTGPAVLAGPKKEKPRKFYPTVYISDVEGLDALPKKGCMLVEFKRVRQETSEDADGNEKTGVTLELVTLCLPEQMDDEDGDTLESVMNRYGKQKKTDESDDEEEE